MSFLVDELDSQLRLTGVDERHRELGSDLPVVLVGVELRHRDAVRCEVGEVAGDGVEVEEALPRRSGRRASSTLRLVPIANTSWRIGVTAAIAIFFFFFFFFFFLKLPHTFQRIATKKQRKMLAFSDIDI